MEEFYLASNGAGRMHCALWEPESAPRAVVQTVGKSARRRTGVAADIARRVNAEVPERFFQFQPAAADIRAGTAAHLNI